MADDTHMATRLGMEAAQGIDGVLQRLATQRAEALVDEERVDGQLVANVA